MAKGSFDRIGQSREHAAPQLCFDNPFLQSLEMIMLAYMTRSIISLHVKHQEERGT